MRSLSELADIYDAEQQLVKALPKMAQAAKNESLRAGFERHLNETKNHVNRLEQVFEIFGKEPKAGAGTASCRFLRGFALD